MMPWRFPHPCLTALLGALLCLSTSANAQTVSIMPLGDSLTWGWDGNESDLDTIDTGGYRDPLYTQLTGQGITVNYVGAANGNASPTLVDAGQTANNGYNGYTIDQIDGNLAGSEPESDADNMGGYWLAGGGGTGRGPETADIILLQIGANDITTGVDPAFTGTPGTESDTQFAADAAARLENLINDIIHYEPNAMLLVDGTTPLYNGATDTTISMEYDSDIAAMIASTYKGTNVHYVDMFDAINNYPGGGYKLIEDDGVHLNTEGYDVMAQTWDAAIMADYDFDAAIPEPSTWALLLGGAALLALRRLRPRIR